VKLKRKIILRMKTRLKNIIYYKFELKYEIENNKTFTKGP
jgi:hypothetical protein